MIIAERVLSVSEADMKRRVVVRLFAPIQQTGDWACRYEIDWPEGRWTGSVAGIDAVQALHLALQKVGLDLYLSSHHQARRLSWDEPGRGYGFPVPKNARDLLVGDDERFDG